MSSVILLASANPSDYRIPKPNAGKSTATIMGPGAPMLQPSTWMLTSPAVISRFENNGVLSAAKLNLKFSFQYLQEDKASGQYVARTTQDPDLRREIDLQLADYEMGNAFYNRFVDCIAPNSLAWFKKQKSTEAVAETCSSFIDRGNAEREVQYAAWKTTVDIVKNDPTTDASIEGPWEDQYTTAIQLWNEDGKIIMSNDGKREAFIHEVVHGNDTLTKPGLLPSYSTVVMGQVFFVWKVPSIIVQDRAEKICRMVFSATDLAARAKREAARQLKEAAAEEQLALQDAEVLGQFEDEERIRALAETMYKKHVADESSRKHALEGPESAAKRPANSEED